MRTRSLLVLIGQVLGIALLSVSVTFAQSTEQCRALLLQTLGTMASECVNTATGTACYGSDFVTGSFEGAVPEGFFSEPGDEAELANTHSIDTSAADFENNTLGMSLLRVDAREAGAATERQALVLVFGGQEIEDAVGPNSTLSPMQSFFLPIDPETMAIAGEVTDCLDEVAPMLFIQGQQSQPVEMVIYSIPVRIESSIVVRLVPATATTPVALEFIVLSGELILNPDTPNEIVVPAGSAISIALGDVLVSLGIEGDADELQLGTAFSAVRTLTEEEREFFAAFVDGLPASILNYVFDFPPIEVPPTPVAPPPTGGGLPGGPVVVPGPVPVTPTCGNFALTSPTDGMAYGVNTVYWNPAVGVSGYTVTITNLDNNQQTSVAAGPSATNVQIDASVLGTGFTAQISVAALGPNGAVCVDVRTMRRAALPPPAEDDDDDEEPQCPDGQQPSGVGGACVPIP